MTEGPRAKAQRLGKPHCARAPNGQWVAVSPGGYVCWAATPGEAALEVCFKQWLGTQLVRPPINPWDYEQMRIAFAVEHGFQPPLQRH